MKAGAVIGFVVLLNLSYSEPACSAVQRDAGRLKRLWIELETCTDSSRQVALRLELADLLDSDPPRFPGNPLDQGGDDCLTANNLSFMPLPLTVSGTTVGYANDFSAAGLGANAPPCWSSYYNQSLSCAGPDVCYIFTAPSTASYRFSLCGSGFDTGLLIYNMTCPVNPVNPGDFICGNDDYCGFQSEIPTLPMFAGQVVVLVVDGWNASAGNYQLMISEVNAFIPNDDCINAISILPGSTTLGSTGGSLPDPAPFCGTGISAPGVWYSVIGTGNLFTASTCSGFSYDTKLNVYTGSCEGLLCIDGNDDACGLGSSISWPSNPGQPYYLLVQGFGGQIGNFELTLTEDVFTLFTECAPVTGGDVGPLAFANGSEVVNACFDPIGPYNFFGRSFLLGHDEIDGFHVQLQTLDRYEPYGMIPDNQDLVFVHDLPYIISGFTMIERIIGSEAPAELLPTLLFESGDPLIVLLSEQGQYFKISTLADTLLLGPYFMSELGYPGKAPVHAAFDNDNLTLYLLSDGLPGPGEEWYLAAIGMAGPLENALNVTTPHPDLYLSALIGTRPVLDMDFIEGQNSLLLLLDNPREAQHIDVTNPLAPVIGPSTLLDNNTWTLSASEGYCDLDGGVGQWVAARVVAGLPQVCTTPCAPSPIPMPYPAYGTYLEPRMGYNIAADESESMNGPVEIIPWIDGPWWPEQITGLVSFDGFTYNPFNTDTSGMADPEITFGDAAEGGDGWRLEYTPVNDEEQDTWLNLCYEIERNGALIYIQKTVRIQDLFKPVIQDPAQDGNPVVPGQSGGVQQPDPSDVAESEVERREVTNPASEEVDPIGQEREDLPPWWYIIFDEEGNPQNVCIPGGAHCAPTATIQQIIALAKLNDCLNRKLNCFLGNGDVITPGFTDDEITRLIKLLGKCMKTNKGECGSRYENTVEGVEKFIKYICDKGELECDVNCMPHIYAHYISVGEDGATLKWSDIQKEFEEKKQTISLRVKKNGQEMTHRISIVSITIRPDGKIEVEVADPAYPDATYTMIIDPSTTPPTIVDDGQPNEQWDKITGAIAISDTTPAEGGLHDGQRALDQEYFTWEPVAQQAGAITNFTYSNLSPGWWKYRVKNHTFGGDSATAYKTVYVPEPLDVTAIREGNDLRLRWNPEPWAVQYIVQSSPTPSGTWSDLATTNLPTLLTEYNSADLKHYRVIAVFGP